MSAAAKWAEVQKKLGPIKKDRKSYDGYMFRGVDDIVDAVSPIAADTGIFLRTEIVSIQLDQYTTKKGAVMRDAIVQLKVWGVDETGDAVLIGEGLGEGSDVADKATMKAQSVAYREVLFKSLLVATGDAEPENTGDNQRGAPQQRPQSGGGQAPPSDTRAPWELNRDYYIQAAKKRVAEIDSTGGQWPAPLDDESQKMAHILKTIFIHKGWVDDKGAPDFQVAPVDERESTLGIIKRWVIPAQSQEQTDEQFSEGPDGPPPEGEE